MALLNAVMSELLVEPVFFSVASRMRLKLVPSQQPGTVNVRQKLAQPIQEDSCAAVIRRGVDIGDGETGGVSGEIEGGGEKVGTFRAGDQA